MSNNQQNIPLLEPEAKSTLGYVVHQWDNRHKRHWSLSPLKNYNSHLQATWAIDVQLHYVACNVNYSCFFLSINNIYKYGWVSIFDSGPSVLIVCQGRDRFCFRVPGWAPAPAQHHYWQGANIHGTSWFLLSSALSKKITWQTKNNLLTCSSVVGVKSQSESLRRAALFRWRDRCAFPPCWCCTIFSLLCSSAPALIQHRTDTPTMHRAHAWQKTAVA